MTTPSVVRVAVNAPLGCHFDYLRPPGVDPEALEPGVRIRVPFGRRTTVGIVVGSSATTGIEAGKLRRAIDVLDSEPLFDPMLLRLLRWASDYYHHPPGEVFAAALPALLRRGRPATETVVWWQVTAAGCEHLDAALRERAPRQAAILELLRQHPPGLDREALAEVHSRWHETVSKLIGKGWVTRIARDASNAAASAVTAAPGPHLTDSQQIAVDSVVERAQAFQCFLLHGVTGSGKTEVYLQIIATALRQGKQALVLVPEIGLTPQLVERFRARFEVPMALIHSGLNDSQRLAAWRRARCGAAPIVIGTRSAVFTPLAAPGVIIIDEEHDPSYKQQDGFRYSARDLAVVRARLHGIPVVLGSATPSLESLHNAAVKRYRRMDLPERPGSASHPRVRVIDLRTHPARQSLSAPMESAIRRHLEHQGQVLLFLNRRGYAPTLFCPACGWTADCHRCDARMTLHLDSGTLRCHHCGAERARVTACSGCGEALKPIGSGTERIEAYLEERFPGIEVARIDRDSIRRKGDLEALLRDMRSGHTRILVGTQMLTKGHHFPDVTLVGIVNADQGLFGTDFRSNERLAQTIVQVAGRAGRAERPGEVLIQTAFPEHPLLRRLIEAGYDSFAAAALEERRESGWPPYSHLALLRAESSGREGPQKFLASARQLAEAFVDHGVALLGPAPSPMERRAGRFRAQLLLQCSDRSGLQKLLGVWVPAVEKLPDARRVRWSLDVDPVELF